MTMADQIVVMRNGVIEQGDLPLNVYARPGTSFVAEFMGKANILDGTIEKVEDETAHVRVASTVAFKVALGNRSFRPGEAVRCVVRPEHIRVDPSGTIQATVRRVVFQGAHVEYLTDLEGQECVFLDTDYYKSGVAGVGQPLNLSIDSRPVWILPGNEATAWEKPHDHQSTYRPRCFRADRRRRPRGGLCGRRHRPQGLRRRQPGNVANAAESRILRHRDRLGQGG
jgi:iron(III) transport system ATP-binding protein